MWFSDISCREKLYFKTKNVSGASRKSLIFGLPNVGQTALQVVQMILSYFLMLIVMYMNAWLFFAVVGGATLGYFCFGWTKLQMIQEQCLQVEEQQHVVVEQHKF